MTSKGHTDFLLSDSSVVGIFLTAVITTATTAIIMIWLLSAERQLLVSLEGTHRPHRPLHTGTKGRALGHNW